MDSPQGGVKVTVYLTSNAEVSSIDRDLHTYICNASLELARVGRDHTPERAPASAA